MAPGGADAFAPVAPPDFVAGVEDGVVECGAAFVRDVIAGVPAGSAVEGEISGHEAELDGAGHGAGVFVAGEFAGDGVCALLFLAGPADADLLGLLDQGGFSGQVEAAEVAAGDVPGAFVVIEGGIDLVSRVPVVDEFFEVFEGEFGAFKADVAVPAGAPGVFAGLEEDAQDIELAVVVFGGGDLLECVVDGGELGEILEGFEVELVGIAADGLDALSLGVFCADDCRGFFGLDAEVADE